jgi:peptidoglycan/LPS O-acetylase OafA/YrhL
MSKKHIKKLDSLRGFAALYVVLYHWIEDFAFVPETFKTIFFSFGQEAVMVFFLLSGFVIYFSYHTTNILSFKYYFMRRFRRIYFPILIAFLISIFIFIFNNKLTNSFSWFEFFGNLIMLQDISFLKPGTWFAPFLGNLPLWSLSYEWWFYLLFFLAYNTIFKNTKRIYLVLGLSVFSYCFYLLVPNQIALILSYFIIWWSGVEIADIFIRYNRLPFAKTKPILFCLFSMCLLTIFPVLSTGKFEFGFYPFLIFRHFSIAFFVLVIALIWYNYKMIFFDKIFSIFTIIAPISYALYIFHYPILMQWKLDTYLENFWLISLIKITLLLSLSYLVEIKLQPIVNHYLK